LDQPNKVIIFSLKLLYVCKHFLSIWRISCKFWRKQNRQNCEDY